MEGRRCRWWVVSLAAGFEGGFLVLAWLLGWLLDQPPLAQLSWNLVDAAWGVAASVPMLLGALALIRWPVGPLARIKQFSEEVIAPLFAVCTPFDLALIALLAGVGEEICFRGVLQPYFADRYSLWRGIAMTSILFGLLHPISGAYILLAAAASVYLGWVFHASGNLLAPIIAHALYDLVMLLYLVRRAPSPPPP